MATTVRKAVIPAAGFGTRFLPFTKAVPKVMLPVVDVPAIQLVVEEAVRSGCDDVLIVTGRATRAVEDHFDRNLELETFLESKGKGAQAAEVRRLGELADVHFVRQPEPLGLGHAIGLARRHVGDEPFAVLLPDDLMHLTSPVLADMLALQARTGGAVLSLLRVEPSAISAYGCAAVEDADATPVRVTGLVEKPPADEAPSDLAVMGRYVFPPALFDAIADLRPGKGGELQLTDAITALVDGPGVVGHVFESGRYDVGTPIDHLKATITFALERDDVGPPLREYLRTL